VTTGGCGGLFTSLLMMLEPGSELLVPDPGWSNYPAMAHVLGATAVGYPLDRERSMCADVEALEGLITERTRALLVNSPANPTGAVEPEENLRAVLDVAARRDLWVISDECYDELVFDGRHTSMATLGHENRVVTVFTFSKSYAMTGWRVGYVVAPPEFATLLSLHQEPVVSCASTVSQHAALTALREPQDCVHEMVAAYRERRSIAAAELDPRGVPYVWPAGSFFMMVDISAAGMDSWAFCRRLLDETGVALVRARPSARAARATPGCRWRRPTRTSARACAGSRSTSTGCGTPRRRRRRGGPPSGSPAAGPGRSAPPAHGRSSRSCRPRSPRVAPRPARGRARRSGTAPPPSIRWRPEAA
jgi:aspartate/methionine/tyrosine aminotransferase